MTRVMLDLESLGNRPGSVIVALGAVKFSDKIDDEFYQRIDPQSCVAAGLTMDVSTIMWWMKQDEAARLEITKKGDHLAVILEFFSQWIARRSKWEKLDPILPEEVEMWGNGATFDNVLLSNAYDAIQKPRPWSYRGDRCYRTIKALYPGIPCPEVGVKHNALDDAKAQALHLIQLLNK